MKFTCHIWAATFLIATCRAIPVINATNPTVTISSGIVVGVATVISEPPESTASVHKYLGIPFAAPPTGVRRFAPPASPTGWAEPFAATKLPPVCMQQFLNPKPVADFLTYMFNNPLLPPPVESEDCLYLNVFAPGDASPKNLKPVLFWIFGGNLQFGGSSLAMYDGSFYAAQQDVVVVVINYRTNIFGFPGAPELPAGQRNVGLLDQRFGLQWTRNNIAQFGGDPEQVTIFGESAGGASVKQLLAQPPSPLPFRAAIMESQGSVLPGIPSVSWKLALDNFHCAHETTPIDCLRNVPATALQDFISKTDIFFPPDDDQVTWTNDVRPTLKKRQFADVPFFLGTNADEGRVFAAAIGLANASSTLDDIFSILIPDHPALGKVISAFYSPIIKDTYSLISTVITDLIFTCKTSSLASYAKRHGYNVWRYHYSFVSPSLALFPNSGAFHTSEIPFVWGSFPGYKDIITPTQQEVALSKFMQTVWANFAKKPMDGPGWPQVGAETSLTLAELGGKQNPTGQSLIAPKDVDEHCFLYDDVIDLTGY